MLATALSSGIDTNGLGELTHVRYHQPKREQDSSDDLGKSKLSRRDSICDRIRADRLNLNCVEGARYNLIGHRAHIVNGIA